MTALKLALLGLAIFYVASYGDFDTANSPQATEAAIAAQFDGDPNTNVRLTHRRESLLYVVGWCGIGLIGIGLFYDDLRHFLRGGSKKLLAPTTQAVLAALLLTTCSGCWRPFKPVELEVIGPTEEAFLIPLEGDSKKQASSAPEEFSEANLVHTKQVQIPQQWVPVGYEWVFPNGVWRPAAVLVKVDTSPVTREWTADPMSGTSNRNEAIWVMTSDQVEFSTGWTVTARITNRAAAVKFLRNYRNGTIETVLDREVRAFVQTQFGLEVTDQPMSKLRLEATPHIQKVVEATKAFFMERGLEITNLGISGGFVYKDAKIQDKLVELFNAEQEKAIALAKAQALKEESTGQAEAAKNKASGEAEAIKSVADAKAYEIEKAKQDLQVYLELKRLELEKARIEKWGGKWPDIFLGVGTELSDLMRAPKSQLESAQAGSN